jgi:transglutaminase-like putative cysteine protease
MKIRAGFDIAFELPQPTPMILMVTVHPSRMLDLLDDHKIEWSPRLQPHDYVDMFGNTCTRIVAPAGLLEFKADFSILDSGLPDPIHRDAVQHTIEELPDNALVYLLGSRYCDTERFANLAWSLFGNISPGWPRVQAICDFVHQHLKFDYSRARPDRTASEGYREKVGVCRDFAHLAIAFCRCANIPARYCTGYLGDIGVPIDPAPMDFSAWFEVFLGGQWHVFDARHNHPRIGRILIGRGRDAADVAISTSFGPSKLTRFTIVTEEIPSDPVVVDAAVWQGLRTGETGEQKARPPRPWKPEAGR